MPIFDLRLYKRASSSKTLHILVQQIDIEAENDAEAIAKAKEVRVPTTNDSDFAILFAKDGHKLWRLDA
jgi:hypothetical protein